MEEEQKPADDRTVKDHNRPAVPLSQFRQTNMICVFCHKPYSGKVTECPNCHRRLPSPPMGA